MYRTQKQTRNEPTIVKTTKYWMLQIGKEKWEMPKRNASF